MSEFLGSRISLISKSDIRYVGTLHEINSDESTVSLENVRSFGTEGRRNSPEDEIAPSDQTYEYIVFRGSDVKDLRIEDHPSIKENKPPTMPDDPAIVGARPRPNQQAPGPNGPQPGGFGPNPYPPNNFYNGPPPPGHWGRGGGGPGPGPAFGNMPYPPPPGWFPPGQGFPHGGPPGPGQWGNQPPFPGGPSVPQAGPQSGPQPGQALASKQAPQGTNDGSKSSPSDKVPQQAESQPRGTATKAPALPVQSKPSVEEVKTTAANLNLSANEQPTRQNAGRNNRVTPVIPLASPATKPSQPTRSDGQSPMTTVETTVSTTGSNTVQDATSAAKAAVAVAMAKLNNPQPNPMDNLANKVNEMRLGADRGSGARGRGRGRAAPPTVPIPNEEYDFSAQNAKFSKHDLIREAIAGSPLEEHGADDAPSGAEGTTNPNAYNKTTSFFDNISSEARERAEGNGQQRGGREWRGEEHRKNMETFGQGSVDGGHRNKRGRGRGRGRGPGRGGAMRGGPRQQYSAAPTESQ